MTTLSDGTIKAIFSKNLRHYLSINEKSPVDLVNDLRIPFSTVSSWTNAQKMPRMGRIEQLADYFGIEKSDLIEDKIEKQDVFTLTDEEKDLLKVFHVLNEEGRKEAINRLMEMAEISRFTKDTASPTGKEA